MKKIGALLTAVALLACLLPGCSPKQSDADAQSSGTSGGTMTIIFGHNYAEDSPAHMAALAFKEHVETASDGAMTVEIYPAMQLGSNREQLEGIQQGSITVGLQPTSIVGNFVNEFQLLDVPFVFPSEEAMWTVLDGDFGSKLLDLLTEKGLHGFGYAWTGFKQITSSKPLSDLASLRGQKIRVMDSPLLLAQYEAWGSNPTPIDFSELYNALQQKVVDGEENNFWTISAQKYYEVQSDLIVSNHAPLPALYMCNNNWYESLTEDQRVIIDEAAEICVQTDREQLRIFEKEAISNIEEHNVTFHELNEAQIQDFKAASQPCYDFARTQVSEALFQELTDAVDAAS